MKAKKKPFVETILSLKKIDENNILNLCLDALNASTEYITALRQYIYSHNPEHHNYDRLNKFSQAEWPLRELAIRELKNRVETK